MDLWRPVMRNRCRGTMYRLTLLLSGGRSLRHQRRVSIYKHRVRCVGSVNFIGGSGWPDLGTPLRLAGYGSGGVPSGSGAATVTHTSTLAASYQTGGDRL